MLDDVAERPPWRVHLTPHAERDCDRLDVATVDRVLDALGRYAETERGDVRALVGRRSPEWRLRVGNYRLRFRRDVHNHMLVVLRVLHRREAYRD